MKKLLFLLGLLLPLFTSAQQIDSFMVDGSYLRFNVPEDWIIESKQDSVQKSGNWNLVLRHAVATKKQYARILVGIHRIENTNSSGETTKSKKIKYSEMTISGRKGIYSAYEKPSGDCYDCHKKFSFFFHDPISPNLIITSGIIGEADQILMNGYFKRKMSNFQSYFYLRNGAFLNQWVNSIIQEISVIKKDTGENSISILASKKIFQNNKLTLVQTSIPDAVLNERFTPIHMSDMKLVKTDSITYSYIIAKTYLSFDDYYMIYVFRDQEDIFADYFMFLLEKPIEANLDMILMEDLMLKLMRNFQKHNNIITRE